MQMLMEELRLPELPEPAFITMTDNSVAQHTITAHYDLQHFNLAQLCSPSTIDLAAVLLVQQRCVSTPGILILGLPIWMTFDVKNETYKKGKGKCLNDEISSVDILKAAYLEVYLLGLTTRAIRTVVTKLKIAWPKPLKRRERALLQDG
ncbi:Hypothetical predicted protein [Podarcis lilfordi]|uniref:Uncharacterized protein n=1 Tax=Podarcis lilfordi TaxID=74358 RepID=A0AA35JX90_9SAUR|nr:Hypothetical predicted protein [Podarcis lilfordi]